MIAKRFNLKNGQIRNIRTDSSFRLKTKNLFNKKYSSVETERKNQDVVLKKFWRLVHPDRFSDNLAFKEQNERSFQELNSYVDFIKSEKKMPVNTVFEFIFHVKPLMAAQAEEKGINTVKYSVRVPESQTQNSKVQHMKTTFDDLFSKCDFVPGPWDVDIATAVKDKVAKTGQLSLIKFVLMNNPGAQRSKEQKKRLKELDQLGIEQTNALKKAAGGIGKEYGIKQFQFDIPEHEFYFLHDKSLHRLRILKKLEKALLTNSEEFKKILPGIFLSFSNRMSGFDDSGKFNLNLNELQDDWVEQLKFYSIEKRNGEFKYSKERLEKEAEVAKLFSVKRVVGDEMIRSSYTYLSTLDKMLKYQPTGTIKNSTNTNIRFAPVDQYDVEITTKTTILQYVTAPQELHRILQTSVPHMVKEYDDLTKSIEVIRDEFNLESLTYKAEPELTLAQLDEALNRLWRNRYTLKPYMNGLRLHIASEYGINRDTNTFSIKHDFML